jgi:hypothetical protein
MAKNRIMIYGPKNDRHVYRGIQNGRRRVAGDIDPERRDGRDQALPGADALRAVRAGGRCAVTSVCTHRAQPDTLRCNFATRSAAAKAFIINHKATWEIK